MTNPTDTNQASEDGLRELAERYAKDFGIRYDKIRINKKGSITYRQSGDNSGGWQESGSSVNLPTLVITRHYQLIRTEKQKLLAEVRERVVGEDKPLQGKYRASGLMSYDMTNHYENSLRAEQRAVLTQLEAEL
jgi:hypothetical protein